MNTVVHTKIAFNLYLWRVNFSKLSVNLLYRVGGDLVEKHHHDAGSYQTSNKSFRENLLYRVGGVVVMFLHQIASHAVQ